MLISKEGIVERTTQQDSAVTYVQGNFSGLLYVCKINIRVALFVISVCSNDKLP